jgi:hypothetical protein
MLIRSQPDKPVTLVLGVFMNEQELSAIRQGAKIEALATLVRAIYTAQARSSPSNALALREAFAHLRQEHGKVVLKNLHPATSDMLAAEYQTAMEDLLSYIESGFPKP